VSPGLIATRSVLTHSDQQKEQHLPVLPARSSPHWERDQTLIGQENSACLFPCTIAPALGAIEDAPTLGAISTISNKTQP